MSNIPLYVESSLKHRLETRFVAPIWWFDMRKMPVIFCVSFFYLSWLCVYVFFWTRNTLKKGAGLRRMSYNLFVFDGNVWMS